MTEALTLPQTADSTDSRPFTTLLSIETSTETCSVALLKEGQIRCLQEAGGARASGLVLPMVQKLLNDAGAKLADCDAIAFGAGPGSFTGLRIACGVVQGLAYAQKIPVLPVSTLEAMAFQLIRPMESDAMVACAIDARMNEVYWAVYARRDEEMVTLSPPALNSGPSAAIQMLQITGGKPFKICGNGYPAYPLMHHVLQHSVDYVAPKEIPIMPHAANIMLLGLQRWYEGKAVSADYALPVYLRNNVAQTMAERQASRGL